MEHCTGYILQTLAGIGGLTLVSLSVWAVLAMAMWLEEVSWAAKQVQPLIDRVNEHGDLLTKKRRK